MQHRTHILATTLIATSLYGVRVSAQQVQTTQQSTADHGGALAAAGDVGRSSAAFEQDDVAQTTDELEHALQNPESPSLGAEADRRNVTLRFALLRNEPISSTARSIQADGKVAPTPVRLDSAPIQRILGWTVLGVGGTAFVAGSVMALIALNDRTSLSGRGCNLSTNQCPRPLQDDVDTYNRRLTFSTASLIGGGVLAATGTVVLLAAPNSKGHVTLGIAPSKVTLKAVF